MIASRTWGWIHKYTSWCITTLLQIGVASLCFIFFVTLLQGTVPLIFFKTVFLYTLMGDELLISRVCEAITCFEVLESTVPFEPTNFILEFFDCRCSSTYFCRFCACILPHWATLFIICASFAIAAFWEGKRALLPMVGAD